jgi:FAD/FMN-containing dehydrogenase
MRMLTPFDKGDPADVERASAANKEMLEAGLRMGFTPVSPPAWAMESLLGRVNPATLRLLRDLHAYLDPLGLLNPGKLPL